LQAPARIRFAVDRLDIRPDSRLFEIGCGRGVAVALIAGRLKTGHITAIDRSATAVAAACQRNAGAIEAGRATIIQSALADADLAEARPDTIFAINVNVFWLKPQKELAVLRPAAERGARILLFYEPPSRDGLAALRHRLSNGLATGNFGITNTVPSDAGILFQISQT
jgi:tRNA A58 N-methylase Trm61